MSTLTVGMAFEGGCKNTSNKLEDLGIEMTRLMNDPSKKGSFIEFLIDSDNIEQIKEIMDKDELKFMSIYIDHEHILSMNFDKSGAVVVEGISKKSKDNFTYFVTSNTDSEEFVKSLEQLSANSVKIHKTYGKEKFTWKLSSQDVINIAELMELSKKFPELVIKVQAFSNTYTLTPFVCLELTFTNGKVEYKPGNKDANIPFTPRESAFTIGVFVLMGIFAGVMVAGIASLILKFIV